jgi:hypothetical protein
LLEADDREAGHGELDVGLDLDPTGLQPDQRVRERASEHPAMEPGDA